MQLKIKMKTDTIVDNLRARLCACGNEIDEVDHETYSPTVSSITHSFMLQVAAHDMHIRMVGTKAAYLCQNYPADATPLYIKLPKRVAIALKIYIYGFPDASRAYYDAYCEHLTQHSYVRTVSDLCLFTKVRAPNRRVYVWIYVDDTLIAADRL